MNAYTCNIICILYIKEYSNNQEKYTWDSGYTESAVAKFCSVPWNIFQFISKISIPSFEELNRNDALKVS